MIPLQLDGSYSRLPETFYQRISPTPVRSPRLLVFNDSLAQQLGLPARDESWADLLSGNQIIPGTQPIAQAYAGHQFGNFVGQLGDGRAVLLGELIDPQGGRWDLHLKGSGPTRFSRRGDGRAALGPMLREYIISEFMNAMGIPTTRALAVTLTGEWIQRDRALPGAILARIARHHVRVGTFEYFAARGDTGNLRVLLDYLLQRDFPQFQSQANPAQALFLEVLRRQAKLVAQWMAVGFVHGVMNTDNMSLAGETIDYGPCAFLDEYDQNKVFSSIDVQGRYAFGRQPAMALWNLQTLASCLLPLFSSQEGTAIAFAESSLGRYQDLFAEAYRKQMAEKLGWQDWGEEESACLMSFLQLLQKDGVDYTLAMRWLGDYEPQRFYSLFQDQTQIESWHQEWRKLVEKGQALEVAKVQMNRVNPVYIPRNHQVERVLALVTESVLKSPEQPETAELFRLVKALQNPFNEDKQFSDLARPPAQEQRVCQTFCGT